MTYQHPIAAACGMLALTVGRKELADALQAFKATGAHIIEKRNTIPILGCVLLEATPDKLTIYGTDLDCMLAIDLACATDGAGALAIEFDALQKAVKSAKGETVRLASLEPAQAKRNGIATLQHDGGTARLPTRLAEDFPKLTTADPIQRFSLDPAEFQRDLDRVAPCISTEETRYYLNGVFFHLTRLGTPGDRTAEHEAAADELAELKRFPTTALREGEHGPPEPEELREARGARIAELSAKCAELDAVRCQPDSLCMAATDGHRMGRVARSIPADTPADMPDVILPRKAVNWIRRRGLKGAGSCSLGFNRSKAAFQAGRMRLVTKLIDGTFPDYTRVIPSRDGTFYGVHALSIDADALAEAAAQVTAHVSHRTRAMTLSMGDGWATAYANCPDNGSASTLIDGTAFEHAPANEGEEPAAEFAVGFNAGYLGDLMASFKGERVTITMQDANAPARLDSDASPEFLSVLMPMRGEGGVKSPDVLRKMNRDALEIFAEDMPARLEDVAKVEAMAADGIFTRREAVDALQRVRSDAGAIVTAAIDLMAARTGWARYQARATILRDLADMRGAIDPVAARAAAAKEKAAMRADERAGPPVPPPAGPIYAPDPTPEPEPIEAVQPDAEPDAPARGTVSPGPICQGEPWPDVLRFVATSDVCRFDCMDDVVSIIANERNSNYRTRIPVRYQETARALFDIQGREYVERGCANLWAPLTDLGPMAEPADPEPAGETVDVAPDVPAVPVEAVEAETPEEASARIRAGGPMFATLQAFKAAAGQGSRWIIDNYAPGTGWGGERVRTVATVRARDVGFIGPDATLEQCQAADVRGFGDRSWIGFPKQPDWESTPEGLVIFYPACEQSGRPAKSVPCIRLRPAPVEDAPAIEEPAADGQPDEVAALRAMVAELTARIEAVEAREAPVERVEPVAAPSAPVEAPEAAPRRSPAHERAIRLALTYRNRVRAIKGDRAHSEAHAAAMVERAIAAEEKAAGLEAANRNLSETIDYANAAITSGERRIGALESMVAKLKTRCARLKGVLIGRNAQIETLGRDLMIARNRAADIRQAGGSPKPERVLESNAA